MAPNNNLDYINDETYIYSVTVGEWDDNQWHYHFLCIFFLHKYIVCLTIQMSSRWYRTRV